MYTYLLISRYHFSNSVYHRKPFYFGNLQSDYSKKSRRKTCWVMVKLKSLKDYREVQKKIWLAKQKRIYIQYLDFLAIL